MEKIVINGGTPLKGEVIISGAKNAAIAILPAVLLINGVCTLENLPNVSDVKQFCDILCKLGVKIIWKNEHTLTIDSTNISSTEESDITRNFRASYYLLGSLLGRCGKVKVGLPGGCKLGARPIDLHIKGFESLGAKIDLLDGNILASAHSLNRMFYLS